MCPTLHNLKEIIAAFGWCDEEDIALNSTLESLQFDSVDHAALINDIEDAFEITITDEEAIACTTVEALYNTILSKS
jgi:acyl carrier protein